ncbi:MAG: electron transfer flavoprotein subunit alpha/FixB family protein [Bacteroidales bacterium]|nr:electron transfer flavoprotein subunit alpha/FixB family protein [Bacteroidales bacterium]
MSILVYTENWDGKFKKLSFELVSYASEIAKKMNTSAIALSIGKVEESELQKLGNYGAEKIISVSDEKNKVLDNQAFSKIIAEVANKENSEIIVFAHNNSGKALAPRVSVKLHAGLVSGVIALPSDFDTFTVSKKAFTGKAIANVVIKSPKKVLTLSQNSFGLIETENNSIIENFEPELSDTDFTTELKEVNKITGKVILTDAEIVISGGRGMKSSENWAPIEELAELLGAATACSRPVSDENWRPHSEHVGQTGKIIAPNLYFALGISGAIQHLGGVSSSKYIVAINTDHEAPIFESADYGIVGDVHKLIPELISEIKELKETEN